MPSGLFDPTVCKAATCTVTNSNNARGTAITCSEKKRLSVASPIP